MIWLNSSYLWLLVLIPLFAAGWFWISYMNRRRRSGIFDDRLIRQLRRGFWELGDRLKLLSLLAALSLFIVGLAGPKIGTEVRDIEQRGVDLLVILDLSRSMNAEDIQPSRLEKAKFEIQRLISRSTGDRIGLLVFTGEAFVQSPMTLDHSALRMFLDIAETSQMPSGGTHFGNAFRKAIETFESLEAQSGEQARVVLLVSDGEDHGPAYQDALNRLTSMGVYIFTVGIGTPEGARIPVYNRNNNQMTGFHRDRQGNDVVTRLETQTLRNIARDGNGEYFEISSGPAGLDPFFSRLDELQQGEFAVREYADYSNRYQLLLIGGIVMFVTALFLPDYRRRAEKS